MARALLAPGIIFLGCAFVLSFLVSISLPFLSAMDIVRIHFGDDNQRALFGFTEIRLGIWTACPYDVSNHRECLKTGHGYAFQVINLVGGQRETVSAAWTRGLAVHPVATAVTLGALVLALTNHTLAASLVSFLAALLTLIAFAIDIALFALVAHAMDKLKLGSNTNTAPGFWMTFVTVILLLLAGCTVCFRHRKENMSASASYPMKGFFSRFDRN
ncbi:hypothetical protein GALMADRAFT_282605 [Galerina marginata CBS 339.88]|uniref:Pali-domain-containing protein n=1 Tax=Galerina marginata (strain CBS 339.88) TaxID=685588 RepID=A0A067SEQ5_GALM3|nr:hypothetical protein GALMADRAFT_282605 [Galerina marginata CBS 339.88]